MNEIENESKINYEFISLFDILLHKKTVRISKKKRKK
jgi:hypothetical protein